MVWIKKQIKKLAFSMGLAAAWVLSLAAFLNQYPFSSFRALVQAAKTGLIATLVIYVLYTLLKPRLRSLNRKNWALLVFFCLCMGLMSLSFSPQKIQPLEIFPHTLTVTALNAAVPGCEPVVLSGFLSDGQFVSYNRLSASGWQRNGTRLLSSQGPNFWTWSGYTRDTILTFEGKPNACPVQVSEDGRLSTYTLDTASPEEVLVHSPLRQPPVSILLTDYAAALCAASVFLVFLLFFYLFWTALGVQPASMPLPWRWSQNHTLILCLAVLAFLSFGLATRQFGLFLVGDSASYFSAGRSLASGEGYIMFDGDDYNWWPPLYPILIAGGFVQRLMPPAWYLWILHGLLFTLTLTGWAILFFSLFPKMNHPLLAALILTGGISASILGSFVTVMSEPGFLCSITWAFVFLNRFYRSQSFSDGLLFCCCVGAAALFRYIGLTVVITACLLLFLFYRGRFFQRALIAISGAAFSSTMEILWIVRNKFLSDSATGLRNPPRLTVLQNFQLTTDVFSSWFAPRWPILLMLLIAACLIFFLIQILILRKTAASPSLLLPEQKMITSLVLFFCFFTLFCILLALVSNTTIENRVLSTVFFPLLALFLFTIQRLGQNQRLKPVALALLVLSLAAPSLSAWLNFVRTPAVTNYDMISLKSLQDDRLLSYLKQNPLKEDLLVYSNCPYCLNYFLKYYNVVLLNNGDNAKEYLHDVQKPFYMVWFSRADMTLEQQEGLLRPEGSYISPPPDLDQLAGRHFVLNPITANEDGEILQIVPQ